MGTGETTSQVPPHSDAGPPRQKPGSGSYGPSAKTKRDMKKIFAIAVLLLVIQSWGDITAFFFPREDPAYSNATEVVLYATSWCGACKKAKAFLDRRGVAYTEYDVERSAEGRRQFQALGGRGVPLMVIDGTTVIGYNPGEMKRLLGL